MKKFKVTFFNPNTLKKRVFKYIFTWDYNNHHWVVSISSIFGDSQRVYSGNPVSFINRISECKRPEEYVSVKTFQ